MDVAFKYTFGLHCKKIQVCVGPTQQETRLEGMDWLQLHWEHMAFLPLRHLFFVRGLVFDYLAINYELLKVSCDVDILLRAHVRKPPHY